MRYLLILSFLIATTACDMKGSQRSAAKWCESNAKCDCYHCDNNLIDRHYRR